MNSAGTAAEPGGRWQISNGPGIESRWRGDGRELYYQNTEGRVMAVEIATSPQFRPGKPQALGLVIPSGTPLPGMWDVTADGKRFLVAAPKSGKPEPFTVVLNWQSLLKK